MAKRIKIIGKISGLNRKIVEENFKNAENYLVSLGYIVVNPTTLINENTSWDESMKICIKSLVDCDAVALQKNWTYSHGSTVEFYIAKNLHKEIIYL